MKLAPTPLAFQGRILFLGVLTVVGFMAVASGYYRVQVAQQERYEQLGEKFRIKTRQIKATRGLILDREKRLVTRNMPTYNLVLLRDEMDEPWRQIAPKLSEFLGLSREYLDKRYATRSPLLFQPVLIKEDIEYSEALRIRRNRRSFPGLSIETTEKRFYSHGELLSHVLGYVGEASDAMLKKNPKLKLGDIVGKSGIELAYNDSLMGKDGEKTLWLNRRGVYVRPPQITTPPQPGSDLYLTLDLDLQKLAADSLEGRGGSVLMMDVRSGEILVFFSSPTFDLNLFTSVISTKKWEELLHSPGRPFLNRPIQGSYAPGSIFKLVTALAGLKHLNTSLYTKHFCNGEFSYYNHTFSLP